MNAGWRIAILVGFAAAVTACRPTQAPTASSTPSGLHNLLSLGGETWSGSTPEGEAGFQTLRDLGIRTVISVDGATPDVATARQYGLRYVHLPMGYGRMSREQAVRLAKAANELPGPFYIHCHHGKHRGPAAAAIVRRCQPGPFSADDAETFLVSAGTDRRYEGLYAAVREFQPPPADELRSVPADFPESVPETGLAARMVEIQEIWDRLRRPEKSAGDAVQLAELYREAARLPEGRHNSEAFQQLFADAEGAAVDLEQALHAGDSAAVRKGVERSAAICTSCHREFRDR